MPRPRFRLLAVVIFLAVFPLFLRRRPRVERRIIICAPPEDIFPLINDLRAWPLWTAWAEREEVNFTYGEIVEGVGAVQRWRTAKMDGAVTITRSEPGTRLDYEVAMGWGKTRFLGRFDLLPDGACTRVTWRCVWQPAENPYMRYVDLFFRAMLTRDFARGLEKLKIAAERKQAPAPALP